MSEQKYKLTALKLREVSLVDAGANPGAHITLSKRKDPGDTVTKDDYAEIRGEQIVEDDLWRLSEAINRAIHSTVRNEELTLEQRSEKIDQSLTQFHNEVLSLLNGGLTDMTKEEMEKLAKQMKQFESAVKDSTAKIDELQKQLADKDAEIAKLKAPDDKQDEVDVTKAADIPEDFRKAFETLQKQAQEDREKIAKMEEADEVAKFEKRAEQYGKAPVSKAELGVLLRAVAGNTDAAETLQKCLTATEEAIGKATETLGNGSVYKANSAETVFYAKAEEIQKAENVTQQKAVQLTQKRHPELWTNMRKSAH